MSKDFNCNPVHLRVIIALRFDVGLRFAQPNLLDFDTQIGLYVKDDSGAMYRDMENIGKYNLYTSLNGDDFDDCLVINVDKEQVNHIHKKL